MEVRSVPSPPGRSAIQSYGPEGFRIADALYPGAIIVLPSGIERWPTAHAPLNENDFAPMLARRTEFDVLLVGFGAASVELPHVLGLRLRAMGLPCELMDTGAACRTYNLLIAEGRRVAAALLPPIPAG
jgi:uncharacterized protein